jgi:hypothetical protein
MVQRNVFLALATGFLLFSSEIALPVPKKFPQLVPEIPDFNLQDFAEVKVVRGRGPVIVFNPVVCAQAGRALCQFSRWHEYGHIVLGHPLRRIKPGRMEIEADRWAAQNAPRDVVLAAYQFFMSGGGASPVHGAGRQRAARLAPYLRGEQSKRLLGLR